MDTNNFPCQNQKKKKEVIKEPEIVLEGGFQFTYSCFHLVLPPLCFSCNTHVKGMLVILLIVFHFFVNTYFIIGFNFLP